MIENIPNPDLLCNSGIEQLNFSWQIVIDTLKLLKQAQDQSELYDWQIDEFWRSSRRNLLSAYAQVFQGVELIIKGKIAEISPYILIDNLIEKTKGCTKPKNGSGDETVKIDFSEFKTIQESDLLNVYRGVSDCVLEMSFIERYETMRKMRNKIMHLEIQGYETPDKLKELAVEIIENILCLFNALFPDVKWMDCRSNAIAGSPSEMLYMLDSNVSSHFELCEEFKILIDTLPPKLVKDFFGFDKKNRLYCCPKCLVKSDACASDFVDLKFAYLISKNPGETKLCCPLCGNVVEVYRTKCCMEKCMGSVCYDGYCLTCLEGYFKP